MIKPSYFVLPALVLLGACTAFPVAKDGKMAELTYQHITPAELQARAVAVPVDYLAPMNEQDIANDFIIPPSEAIHKYFKRKLIPVGVANSFEVELEQASIFKQYVPSTNRWKSAFELGAMYEYTLTAKFKMLYREDSRRVLNGKRLVFNKQFSIPADESIAGREAREMAVIESLVGDVDAAVSAYLVDAKIVSAPSSKP